MHLIGNNTRFLILPAASDIANLASHMLGRNTRRLSAEWATQKARSPTAPASSPNSPTAHTRWKIETEGFNTLKTKGYHLMHNFRHGKSTLANVLATLNLFVYTLHTACGLLENYWQLARKQLVTRADFFRHLSAIVCY
ncbi:MAG: hypothetical protein OXD01_00655 [Gammaproteobacteria bacterium]|nr:hypothetical protein [Gammaproteobacteria bacterium]